MGVHSLAIGCRDLWGRKAHEPFERTSRKLAVGSASNEARHKAVDFNDSQGKMLGLYLQDPAGLLVLLAELL